MSIITKIFGDANEKYLRKLQPIVERINSLEKEFEGFSNEQLRQKTQELKEELNRGRTCDDILPEAFALVREAAKRTLGQRHFDCQLIGGIVLHQGKIAEMKTGEGKTLAATLPLYLNALDPVRDCKDRKKTQREQVSNGVEGKGCHLVTVNDYLAKRDTVWMGQIYHALGLSVGCIVHEAAYLYDPEYQNVIGQKGKGMAAGLVNGQKSLGKDQKPITEDQTGGQDQKPKANGLDRERDLLGGFKVIESYLRPCSRREAYLADITYGTNNEFGFDYLRDNMAYSLDQMVQTRRTTPKENLRFPTGQALNNTRNHAENIHNFAIVDEVDSILIDEARTPLIISRPDIESSKWYEEFARIIPKLNLKTDYEIDEKMRAATLTEEGINKIEKILGMGNIYQEKGIKYLHHLEQALRAEVFFKKDRDYVVKDGQVIIIDEFTGRLMPGRRWSGGLHQAIEAKEGLRIQPESMTLASITFQNYFRLYKKLAGMTGTAATSAEEFYKVYGLDVIVVPTNKPMIRDDLPDRIYKSEAGKFQALVREIKERHQMGQPVLVGTRSVEKNEYLGKLLEREGIPHQILNAKHHEREGEIIAQAGKKEAVTVATNMAGRGVDIILGGNPQNPEKAKEVVGLGGLHVIGTERHEARRIDNQLRGRSGRQGDSGSSQFFISLEDDLMRIFGGERIKSLMDVLKVPEDEAIEASLVAGAIESAQAKIEGLNFDLRKHVLEYDDVLNKHREVIYKKRKRFSEIGNWKLEIGNWTKSEEEKKVLEEKEKELKDNFNQVAKFIALRTLDMLWVEHLENMEYLRDSVRLRAYGQKDPLVEYKNEGHKMFQRLLETIESNIAQTILRASLQPAAPPLIPADKYADSRRFGQSVKRKIGRNDPCPCGKKDPVTGRTIKYKKCCYPKFG